MYFSGTNFDLSNEGELIREMYFADCGEEGETKRHFKGPGRLGGGRAIGLTDGYADMKKKCNRGKRLDTQANHKTHG